MSALVGGGGGGGVKCAGVDVPPELGALGVIAEPGVPPGLSTCTEPGSNCGAGCW